MKFGRLYEGIFVTTPRGALQQAYIAGWIENESLWLDMLRDRNLTSHTYREEQAMTIYAHIPQYAHAMGALHAVMRQH